MLGKKCTASEDAAVAQGAWFIAPKGLVERTVAAATPAGRRRGLRELSSSETRDFTWDVILVPT